MLAVELAVLDQPWLEPRLRADTVAVGGVVGWDVCDAVVGDCGHSVFLLGLERVDEGDWKELWVEVVLLFGGV